MKEVVRSWLFTITALIATVINAAFFFYLMPGFWVGGLGVFAGFVALFSQFMYVITKRSK